MEHWVGLESVKRSYEIFGSICKISPDLIIAFHLITKDSIPRVKWSPFRRRHFQTHFYEWKAVYFYSNFTEMCP